MIRLANRYDIPEILNLLRNFRAATPVPLMAECDDERYITTLMTAGIVGGLCYVAERDGHLVGMIMGVIDHSMWDPHIYILKEMVYWVEPEHRNTTVGYRLLKQYVTTAREMVDSNRIQLFTMTKMTNSPDLNLERFGFSKVEETYVGIA